MVATNSQSPENTNQQDSPPMNPDKVERNNKHWLPGGIAHLGYACFWPEGGGLLEPGSSATKTTQQQQQQQQQQNQAVNQSIQVEPNHVPGQATAASAASLLSSSSQTTAEPVLQKQNKGRNNPVLNGPVPSMTFPEGIIERQFAIPSPII